MNVVLIGFRCSGKSSVGRALATKLGREFIDCDDYIEKKTRLTIRELFDLEGETRFRALESETIAELAKMEGKVIAIGGGATLKYRNMKVLKRSGKIVFLEVEPETAFRRMEGSQTARWRKPEAKRRDPCAEMKEQMGLRNSYFLKSADFAVRTDRRPVKEIVGRILEWLQEWGIGEGKDRDPVPV